MKENICSIGDRVEITSFKGTKGIVIDTDKKAAENMPRAKVVWKLDTTIDKLYQDKETWICEGNLTLLHNDQDLIDVHYPKN